MLMTAQDFLDSESAAAAKSAQAHNNKWFKLCSNPRWFEQIDDPSLCGWIASIVAKVLEEAARKLSSWYRAHRLLTASKKNPPTMTSAA